MEKLALNPYVRGPRKGVSRKRTSLGKVLRKIASDSDLPDKIQRPLVRHMGGGLWRLEEKYELFGSSVEPGYIFDGASIPRPFWWWTTPTGEAFLAGLIHDKDYDGSARITRREADAKFYRNLRRTGIRITMAYAMWLGVRGFGWIPWNRHVREYKEDGMKSTMKLVLARAA